MLKPIKCLLVDDDVDDQEIFQIALEEIDQQVECIMVNDGIQALALLEQDPFYFPDIIFLDLNMPRMTGIECLSKMREIPSLRITPIIIMTNSRAVWDRDETFRQGGTHFYSKPTGITQLTEALKAFFKEISIEK